MNLGNVFILGDSYSTYKGYIPNENSPYYSDDGKDSLDVTNVNLTWWKKLIDETGSNLVLNESYSGSTYCYTGYNGDYVPKTSFVGRLRRCVESGVFKTKIDTVLVMGGTNDTWAKSPVGKLMYENRTEEDLKEALPAFCEVMEILKANVKDARIIIILNKELSNEITEGYKAACKHYSVEYMELLPLSLKVGHPTKAGMEEIKDQIIKYIEK